TCSVGWKTARQNPTPTNRWRNSTSSWSRGSKTTSASDRPAKSSRELGTLQVKHKPRTNRRFLSILRGSAQQENPPVAVGDIFIRKTANSDRLLELGPPGSGPPDDDVGAGLVRVAPPPLAVRHALAGHRQDETPVSHHQRGVPVVQGGHLGTEQAGAVDDAGLGLLARRPPDLVDGREVVLWPGDRELRARRADVAGEGVALAHDRVDEHRQAERLGDGCRGLQGAGVGRGDDARDPLVLERLGGAACLVAAEVGELGVLDAGVAARAGEGEVELALAVAEQDHAAALAPGGGGVLPRPNFRCASASPRLCEGQGECDEHQFSGRSRPVRHDRRLFGAAVAQHSGPPDRVRASGPAAAPGRREPDHRSQARTPGPVDARASAARRRDRARLRPLLGDELYGAFDQAIAAREANGERQHAEVRSIPTASIEAVALHDNQASITVKFVSDQVSYTTGKDGQVTSGNEAVTELTDIWTFERDLTSRDPSWKLVAAQVG